MELIEVQIELARIDSRYVCWLEWTDNNGFIKAYIKRKRKWSMQAQSDTSKVFRELGGGFVVHDGERYFEVAKKPRAQRGGIAEAGKQLLAEGIYA